MLYLIGLGLNTKGISLEGFEAIKKCSQVYLEGYTVDFPYETNEIEKTIGKEIEILGRDRVESDFLIKKAKKQEVALLVYGCPLFATTHFSLISDARKEKIKTKIIYSTSIFDAIGETGLQLYKFGKITSMPRWIKDKFEPDSFLDIVKENISINSHSLILCDIGLSFKDALEQLKNSIEKKKIKLDKIVVCTKLGTENAKIIYANMEKLAKQKIEMPFCIIIPSEDLHFTEKESLEEF